MFANTGSPAFTGQGAKQGGDPRFLPGRREGGAAARQTGAAGAGQGLVRKMVAGAGGKPAGGLL